MQRRSIIFLLLAVLPVAAAIIDRIAIIVGNSIIKDSDIDRDLRVTAFLNQQPLNMTPGARKTAANRLIDQVFIRQEIRIGSYPRATMEQAEAELSQLEKQRFKTPAAFQDALKRYGLTELQLREQFQWELTVLRFIDARFKPGVEVTDEEIQKYYSAHRARLQREHPGKSSLDDVTEEIRSTLAGEQVNKLFFAWLDDQRKGAKIQYFEESLR